MSQEGRTVKKKKTKNLNEVSVIDIFQECGMGIELFEAR